MFILIDKDELRMVAAAESQKWINLVMYVDFPNRNLAIVDADDGKTWTTIDSDHMKKLYANMSGQLPPGYKDCIEQLRSYANTWPNYPKSEAELEKEAERIYQQEKGQPTVIAPPGDIPKPDSAAVAALQAAAGAPPDLSKPEAPKPAASASNERPRQGITKRIWEIADELLAVTGSMGNAKEFRSKVIVRAEVEGANPGTAATQFGKWKASKGL